MGVPILDGYTATTTWSSQHCFEISNFEDAASVMKILVENGYDAKMSANKDGKNKKKRSYIVETIFVG